MGAIFAVVYTYYVYLTEHIINWLRTFVQQFARQLHKFEYEYAHVQSQAVPGRIQDVFPSSCRVKYCVWQVKSYGDYSSLRSTLTDVIDVWKCWTGLKWLRIGCRGCYLDQGTERLCSLKQKFILCLNRIWVCDSLEQLNPVATFQPIIDYNCVTVTLNGNSMAVLVVEKR